MDVAGDSRSLEDPFVDVEPDVAATSQKFPQKRSLFKRPAWAKPTEDQEAVELFSRAKEMFPKVVIAETERKKRERELEKARLTRESEELDRETSTEIEQKRRRVFRDREDDDDSESNGVRPLGSIVSSMDHTSKKLKGSPSMKLKGSPSTRRRTSEPKLNDYDTNSSPSIISLGDSDDTPPPKARKSTDFHFGSYSSDDEPVKRIQPAPNIPTAQVIPDMEEEDEFAAFISIAREATKRKPFAVLGNSTNFDSGTSPRGGASNPIPRPNLISNSRPHDPIVSLLITSHLAGTVPLNVKRKLSQRLKDVRLAWCDRQLINSQPLDPEVKKSIFLTWRGTRLFDVTTCGSMGINMDGSKFKNQADGFENGMIHLEAWTEETYEQFQKQKRIDRQRKAAGPLADSEEEEVEVEELIAVEKPIRIIIKAREFPEFKVMVKPSTPVAKLMAAFRINHHLELEKEVELRFDGDVLAPDSLVSEADLEDMSSVDAYVH